MAKLEEAYPRLQEEVQEAFNRAVTTYIVMREQGIEAPTLAAIADHVTRRVLEFAEQEAQRPINLVHPENEVPQYLFGMIIQVFLAGRIHGQEHKELETFIISGPSQN